MKILTIILSFIIFVKTYSYGIYELKSCNKIAGLVVIAISIISLLLPNIIIAIRGI